MSDLDAPLGDDEPYDDPADDDAALSGVASGRPGIDRWSYASEWETIWPEVETSPAESLHDLDDIVRRMLHEHGYAIGADGAGDAVTVEGDEIEVVDSYRAAHEIALAQDERGDVAPGDIAHAVNLFRAIYESVVDDIGGGAT